MRTARNFIVAVTAIVMAWALVIIAGAALYALIWHLSR